MTYLTAYDIISGQAGIHRKEEQRWHTSTIGLHFGCANPFCGHGDPALPLHYEVPLDNTDMTIKLLSHEDGKLKIEVAPKNSQYPTKTIECDDNLEACSNAFEEAFNKP